MLSISTEGDIFQAKFIKKKKIMYDPKIRNLSFLISKYVLFSLDKSHVIKINVMERHRRELL